MRLLVVEDEARIAAFVSKGLQRAGHDVLWVETGIEALASAGAEPFDLVLLDLGLPDLDGTEVLRRLRSSGITTPVLVITARNDGNDRRQCLDLGADGYLTKPFAFTDLLSCVQARVPHAEAEVG